MIGTVIDIFHSNFLCVTLMVGTKGFHNLEIVFTMLFYSMILILVLETHLACKKQMVAIFWFPWQPKNQNLQAMKHVPHTYKNINCRNKKTMGSKFLQDIYLEYFIIFGGSWL